MEALRLLGKISFPARTVALRDSNTNVCYYYRLNVDYVPAAVFKEPKSVIDEYASL